MLSIGVIDFSYLNIYTFFAINTLAQPLSIVGNQLMKTSSMQSKLTLLLVLCLGITSCTLFDNESPTPMFLDIPTLGISTGPGQGEPTENFSDVWVTVNGQNIGVYPLPATVPIVIDNLDEVNINLFPGIRNNGDNSAGFIYSLMQPESYTLAADPGATIQLQPVFKYKSEAKFDFVESFEAANIFTFKGNSNLGGCLEPTVEEASTGSRSGKITLNATNRIVEIGTQFTYSGSDNGGADSYLEFEYKNDVPIFAGIYKVDNNIFEQVYDAVITPKEDWNKIYIDFTLQLVSPTLTEYRVMFYTTIDGTGLAAGEVYLDNVKFVHF